MQAISDLTVNSLIIHNGNVYVIHDTAGLWTIIRKVLKIGESFQPVGPDDFIFHTTLVYPFRRSLTSKSLPFIQ